MVERLEEPQLGTLELSVENGYRVRSIDLGYPAARAAVVNRVNAHGTDDATAFYGARVVALVVMVEPGVGVTRRQAEDRLRAYASPARRPVLYFNDDDFEGEPDRLVRLRGDQLGTLLVNPYMNEVQVQWVAPSGVIEGAVEQVVDVSAVAESEAGRTYPRTYPITYPDISARGAVDVANAGTEAAAPVFRLWGPCTDPSLVNVSTGESLTLEGLALTDTQYAEVDVEAATIRLQGLASQNLYPNLSLDSALWWLQPGSNLVRYTPATYEAAAHAEVIYRPAWL